MTPEQLREFLTGVDPDALGTTFFGQGLAGLTPGGGALQGLAQIGAGVADVVGTRKEIERQRRLKDRARARGRQARAELEDFDFDVSQAERDLATAGIRPTDLSPIQEAQATELAALASDPRALMGGVGASTRRAQQAALDVQQQDLDRELDASKRLAGLEQQALQRQQGLDLSLLLGDQERAFADRLQAQENIEAARQRRREGIGSIIQGVGGIAAAAAAGLPPRSGPRPERLDEAPILPVAPINTITPSPTLLQGASAALPIPSVTSRESAQDMIDSMDIPTGSQLPAFFPPVNRPFTFEDLFRVGGPRANNEDGGKIKYGHGGQMSEDVLIAILQDSKKSPVVKLEGEFDHSTNKKAIIDEETGIKEAEATGGEYILNPEQGEQINMAYKAVESIMESGEEPTMEQLLGLYKAVRDVFSQPQFNES